MEEEMLAAAKLRKNFSPDRVIEADRKNSKKDGSALELELHEYVVRKTGAKATINNSKTLIHQFCQKLPLDRYYSDKLLSLFRTELLVLLWLCNFDGFSSVLYV